MGYCNKCSCEREDTQFCPVCGTELIPLVDGVLERPEMPMKWYKFVIFFQLFAMAVLHFISGLSALIGGHYQGMADTVYEMLPQMLPVDVIYGLVLIGIAAFALVVRSKLANWKACGPRMYLILLSVNVVASLAYTIIVAAVLSGSELAASYTLNDYTSLISGTVTSVIMIVCNVVYFKKRAHLFEN